MKALTFGSVITAMVTPFHDDGKVNFQKAQELAQYLLENGSDSLVVSGTTGESPTLSFQEKIDLFSAVKESVNGKGYVIAGTGTYSTEESVELSKAAAKAGADGLMLVVPYYNKPTQEGLYRHFKTVAQSTGLPVILYNIPSRTSCNLLPETVQRLSEIENIIGIKESVGNIDQLSQLRKMVGNDFAIYSGDDSATLPMLALGGTGVISVAAHLVGKRIKTMINLFKSGDTKQALDLHLELFDLFKGLFITTSPILIKTALNMLDWNLGGLRSPLSEATEKEKIFMENLLKRYRLK
ncbi:MAG: 4-hydroxy-tetrahydrodipicolinate synthase [Bacillota bacterium]|nr:4-hydroxy-tetrahydrodipicolinate synthase [Clostridia bacterium]